MVTKTLTITEDAYGLLAESKLESESFSEEIRRIMGEKKSKSLMDFFGVLSEEEGDDILMVLEKKRDENRKYLKLRKKELIS